MQPLVRADFAARWFDGDGTGLPAASARVGCVFQRTGSVKDTSNREQFDVR